MPTPSPPPAWGLIREAPSLVLAARQMIGLPPEAERRQRAGGRCQPAREQLRPAGRAHRFAHRDERSEQDQDRPVDGVVRLTKCQDLRDEQDHREPEEGDRDRHEVERDQRHRGREEECREIARPAASQGDVALGERQAAELAQRIGQNVPGALHDDVARRFVSRPVAYAPCGSP